MATGERIKAARKKAGLTQKALGEKCNMPDSQIRQYELGMVNPRIEQLRRIAAALGIYISDLVDDWSMFSKEEISEDLKSGSSRSISHEKALEMGGYPLADSEKPLLKIYRQLNQEGQGKAIEHVELLTRVPEYRKEDNIVPMMPKDDPMYVNAAHAIPGASEKDKQHNEDIMNDENF